MKKNLQVWKSFHKRLLESSDFWDPPQLSFKLPSTKEEAEEKPFISIENPNKFLAWCWVAEPRKTFLVYWYQRIFGRELWFQCCRAASYLSEVILLNHPWSESPTRPLITLLPHISACASCSAAPPLCPRSLDPSLITNFSFLALSLFLYLSSLNLSSFLLQLCQTCIILIIVSFSCLETGCDDDKDLWRGGEHLLTQSKHQTLL